MIILLHAGFDGTRLVLWGEGPLEANPPRPRRRKPKLPRALPHPFSASDAQLGEALAAAGISLTTWDSRPGNAREYECAQAFVWLPSTSGGPLPSSPILGEAPPARGSPHLVPWAVPSIALDGDALLALLSRCAEGGVLAPGVAVGPDLAFWGQALRVAGTLAARGRILPGLRVVDGDAWAVWGPVPGPDERQRIGSLASAMPPAARAVALSPEEAAPEPSSRAILDAFLTTAVNRLARKPAASRDRGAPGSKGRQRARSTAGVEEFESIHDHWLHALGAPDGRMDGADPKELAVLASQIQAWQEPLTATDAAPHRLVFRLEEPVEDEVPLPDGDWRVRYLIQAVDDPSLQVPAEEVWRVRGRGAAALKRGRTDAKPFLLAALGQAAGLCPRIEESLRSRAPAGHSLDLAGAHDFLCRTSLLLEGAGFGVQLPAWWGGKGTKLRLTARGHVKSPKLQAGGQITLDRVISVNWEVALGGESLTLSELEELARLKAPLVRVRGQWVEVSGDDIRAAIATWKRKGPTKTTVGGLIRMALGAEPAPGQLDLDGVAGDGWVGELLERIEGHRTLSTEPVPASFAGTLRPYQIRGYAWLAFLRDLGLGACLADDMGLGKTVQALALVLRDRARGERRPVLLVCPTSVVGNWEREAARFAPDLPVLVHHGVGRSRGPAFTQAARKHALVVCSYALLHRDTAHLGAIGWAGVILDEAQNIKNPETRQARTARSLAADYRLALTGTPVENHVGDLWSIMEFLNPGLLGTQSAFRTRFFLPIQARRDPEAADRLRRITGPFVLRRMKTDRTIIADLPAKLEMKVFCGLTREQASLYRAVAKEAEDALADAEGIQRKGLVLATISKLKQVCNHPAHLLGDGSAVAGRSGKLARLTEMLEEALSVEDRALVFTQFTQMGEILRRHLQERFGREVPFLHGGVAKKRRDRMVEEFQAAGGPPVLLLSLKAGGTGLNLTRANHVFHYDRWWNPAVEDQATDRAFRIGQTRDVQVHKFLCAGTLEEAIDEMIEAKKGIASRVIGAGEGWVTELSNDELRKVFALRAEAMGE
ncbi:MAG: DEAD/DEAH box helicase [Longimicrobiales bacterium]|nr:DEAD/DEAH box helicase [Longimicrobiales bacterium]